MRKFLLLLFSALVIAGPANSAIIGFDYTLSGDAIDASPFFGATFPSAPIPGPVVSEYKKTGVTFDGGVILDYGAFGGPSDSRTDSGFFLSSPPNLLATTDIFSLGNGEHLTGEMNAVFEFPVSAVSTSVRNGFAASTFELIAYNKGVIVDSDTVSLGPFLSSTQDGLLAVSAPSIDEVRITSLQPSGQKDFGIDRFEFDPLSSQDSLHSSFELATISAKPSETDQDIAIGNFNDALQALLDLDEDGKATGEEAIVFAFGKILEILFALDVLAGKATATFIILPCGADTTILTYANCGEINHLQIDASLFDVSDFLVAIEYNNLDEFVPIGSEYVASMGLDGFNTVVKGSVLDVAPSSNGVRVDYRIQAISDVTSATVPAPASFPLFVSGLILLGILRRRRRSV